MTDTYVLITESEKDRRGQETEQQRRKLHFVYRQMNIGDVTDGHNDSIVFFLSL